MLLTRWAWTAPVGLAAMMACSTGSDPMPKDQETAGTTGGTGTGGTGTGGTGTGGTGTGGTGTGSGCPGGRYVVLDAGVGPRDGSGQVKDTSTGLVWDRFPYDDQGNYLTQAQAIAYCQGKGARLPTKDEALGISGVSYDACAWPGGWYTWTSTSAGAGLAWSVDDDGSTSQDDVGDSDGALCVR